MIPVTAFVVQSKRVKVELFALLMQLQIAVEFEDCLLQILWLMFLSQQSALDTFIKK